MTISVNKNSETNCGNSDRPIIILGCPRSGTLLASRVIGGSDKHFLITEHSNKAKYCSEDKSGINDTVLWWKNFEYLLWDESSDRPLVETPVYNRDHIEKVKRVYIEQAKSKRLVLKNPAHLTRVRFLKEMFPSALFVFCVRNPWHTLQSMVVKGNNAFLLKTFGNYVLPDDLLMKAAFSWGEAVEVFLRERDDNWVVVKYEDMVLQSRESVRALYDALSVDDETYFEKASCLPVARDRNYYHIKKMFQKTKYKSSIMRAIEPGCKLFSYSSSLDELSEHELKYHLEKTKKKARSLFVFGKRAVQKVKSR